MNQTRYRIRRPGSLTLTMLLSLLLFIAAFAVIDRAGDRITAKQAELLESSIQSACVNAYAVNGRYPSLSEIEDVYGVVIDREHFSVHYSAFASNIMPDISVNIRK